MDSETLWPERLGAQVERGLGQAKYVAARLKAEAKRADQARAVWQRIQPDVDRKWLLHANAHIQKRKGLVVAAENYDHELADVTSEIRTAAREYLSRLPTLFPRLIEQSATEAGVPIDPGSRHPTYTFEQGFFRVDVNDRGGQVRVTNRECRPIRMLADVDAVMETVKREHTRVFGRAFDATATLVALWSSYQAVTEEHKQVLGGPVPIREVTRRIVGSGTAIRSDELLVDISRLVNHGPTEIDGWRLSLQQTRDDVHGIFLHGTQVAGYVGSVLFRRI